MILRAYGRGFAVSVRLDEREIGWSVGPLGGLPWAHVRTHSPRALDAWARDVREYCGDEPFWSVA